jgi:hypothetical protein
MRPAPLRPLDDDAIAEANALRLATRLASEFTGGVGGKGLKRAQTMSPKAARMAEARAGGRGMLLKTLSAAVVAPPCATPQLFVSVGAGQLELLDQQEGVVTTLMSLVVTCATEGAAIFVTLDGSDPCLMAGVASLVRRTGAGESQAAGKHGALHFRFEGAVQFKETVEARRPCLAVATHQEKRDSRLASSPPFTVVDERALLVALYTSTGGKAWHRQQHWLSERSIAEWEGVTVENGWVVSVDLGDNNLRGRVPSCLAGLLRVERIALQYNMLYGPVPALSTLSRLRQLVLHDNHLHGEFPDVKANGALRHLFLHNNDGFDRVDLLMQTLQQHPNRLAYFV